eukprot:8357238-Karenia_brevis.AAC.1
MSEKAISDSEVISASVAISNGAVSEKEEHQSPAIGVSPDGISLSDAISMDAACNQIEHHHHAK